MADPAVLEPTTSGVATAGTKRTAGPSPAEPPPKVKKVAEKTNRETIQHKRAEPPAGILLQLCARFSTPVPQLYSLDVEIETINMSTYFKTLRNALITALYPDHRFHAAGLITEDNFVLVCRYLTKSRLDYVYAATTGRRLDGRIAMPRDMLIPKALADIINGIGPLTIQAGAYTLIPKPETRPADAAQRLETLVTHVMLNQFSQLVNACASRNYIRTGFLSNVIPAMAWWALGVYNAAVVDELANGVDSTRIVAAFKEWTPADAVLAAIVQRQFTGITIYDPYHKWTCDTIVGCLGLQTAFNLEA